LDFLANYNNVLENIKNWDSYRHATEVSIDPSMKIKYDPVIPNYDISGTPHP